MIVTLTVNTLHLLMMDRKTFLLYRGLIHYLINVLENYVQNLIENYL